MINQALSYRKSKLLLLDIAVPRDIEPCHNLSDDVFNYDVDDLKGLVDANLKERQMAAEAISNEIPAEIKAHNDWVNMLGVVPVIRALREKAMTIQAETMDSIIENYRIYLNENEQSFLNILKVLLIKC